MSRRIALAAAAAVLFGTATYGVVTAGQSLAWNDPNTREHIERLDLELPVDVNGDELADIADRAAQTELTGTDAGLITEPAPPVAAELPVATSSPRSSSVAPPPVAPPVVEAPPVLVEPAPPIDPDPTDGQQLPEEVIGSYRCPDPLAIVVSIAADGSLVCAIEGHEQ